jgi:sulfatase maturation enzyme AslB (radical SAM superfamily)
VALKQALTDPFFSKVKIVGVNGGEPSLYKDIEGLLDALFVLKKIKRIHLISNALLSERLLNAMKIIKRKCLDRGITVYLTISLDGVEDVNDVVRGVPNSFSKTLKTISFLREKREDYCDVLDIGCTISKENVEYIQELECFVESLHIDAYYHPAVPNKRLNNFHDTDFSIMYNKRSKQLATEYFYCRYKKESDLRYKLRSYLIYHYLMNDGNKRLAGCQYLKSDVTITETLDMFLCATASDKVGNLKESSATNLLKSGKLKEEEKKVSVYCSTCVHYIVFPSIIGLWCFLKQLFQPYTWIHYKLMSLWLR